jgi:diguanylate cyclase (GGDEF)-like protein
MLPDKVILSVLLDLTQRFTQDAPLEEVLEQVTDAALHLLPGDHASIRVFDELGKELLCGARSGKGATNRPLSFRRGEGILGWVVDHAWVAHVRDTMQDERFLKAEGQGFTVRSIIAVPLLSAGRSIGVLAVSSPSPNAFGAEDEALTLLLANCTVPLVERARLERLALMDPLTGAYNERYLGTRLADHLDQARRSGGPVSVALLDLDHLRRVNQLHGFGAGDQVLKAFAERARSFLRGPQRLVRRAGGTFAVLLPEVELAEASRLLESLRVDLEHGPLVVADTLPVVQTIAAGVAGGHDSETGDGLLERAEAALKEAKRLGGNRIVTDPTV